MALGRKSIVVEYEVTEIKNSEKSHVVLVQANKNFGICDVLHVTQTGGKERLPEVLAIFQGRQINDEEVSIHLWNVLNEIFNPKEN